MRKGDGSRPLLEAKQRSFQMESQRVIIPFNGGSLIEYGGSPANVIIEQDIEETTHIPHATDW